MGLPDVQLKVEARALGAVTATTVMGYVRARTPHQATARSLVLVTSHL